MSDGKPVSTFPDIASAPRSDRLTVFFRLIFLVPLGFIAACVAAGIMATLGIFGLEYLDVDGAGWYLGGAIALIFWAGTIAFLPATIAIILAETFGWRSILYYLLAGGLIGAAAIHLTMQSGALDFAARPNVALLAAGFVGGFVYWLIAGRLAGNGIVSGPPSGPA